MKRKVLVGSLLSMLMSLGVVVGGTFAVFTSEAETNIAISSGKVEVVATAELTQTYSRDEKTLVNGVFENGGTAEVIDGEVKLNNLTPGDKAEITISVENKSNVLTQYRTGFCLVSDEGLFSGLNVMIDDVKFTGVKSLTKWTRYTGTIEDVKVVVELPYDAGNIYQNTSSTLRFFVEAAQANAKMPDALVSDADEFMEALNNPSITSIELANDIALPNGAEVTRDLELNLNGKTISASENRKKVITVTGDADLTVYSGKIVAECVKTSSGWEGAGAAISFDSTGHLSVTDVEMESYRPGWWNVEVNDGTAEVNNVKIDAKNGSAGIVAGGKVVVNNCEISVTGMWDAPYNSTALAVWGGGDLTVNSGTYSTEPQLNDKTASQGNWVALIMNSGGTMTLNGGHYEQRLGEGITMYSSVRSTILAQAIGGKESRIYVNESSCTFAPLKENNIVGLSDQDGKSTAEVVYMTNIENDADVEAAANEGKIAVIAEGAEVELLNTEIESPIKGKPAIRNYGKLSINGGKYANNNIDSQGSAVIENYGELIIEDGEFGSDLNRGAAIQNYGTATINGGTFATMDRNHSANGYAYVFIAYSGSSMTINDATVDGNPNGIFYANPDSTISVNGGNYRIGDGSANTWYVAYASTNATIYLNGGTYNWYKPAWNSISPVAGNVIISENCVVNW